MDEAEYRQLVYAQFSCLTIASSFMSRAIACIHLDDKLGTVNNLHEAMTEIAEAFERLDKLAGREK